MCVRVCACMHVGALAVTIIVAWLLNSLWTNLKSHEHKFQVPLVYKEILFPLAVLHHIIIA